MWMRLKSPHDFQTTQTDVNQKLRIVQQFSLGYILINGFNVWQFGNPLFWLNIYDETKNQLNKTKEIDEHALQPPLIADLLLKKSRVSY